MKAVEAIRLLKNLGRTPYWKASKFQMQYQHVQAPVRFEPSSERPYKEIYKVPTKNKRPTLNFINCMGPNTHLYEEWNASNFQVPILKV